MEKFGTWLADTFSFLKKYGEDNALFNDETLVEKHGDIYLKEKNNLRLPRPEILACHSLDGLLDYRRDIVAQGIDGFCFKASPQAVELLVSHVGRKTTRPIFKYAYAEPIMADLSFIGRSMGQEDALINLKTCFQQDESVFELVQLLGTIKVEESITTADDGFSQEVTAKSGISLVSKKALGVFTLKPYETFSEIQEDIPGRMYIVRIKQTKGDKDSEPKIVGIALHASKDASVDIAISREIKCYLVEGLKADGFDHETASRMVLI